MPNVVEIKALEKVYRKSPAVPAVYALRGIDVAIPQGQYVAVMGPSGSGKSTLMNILGCLDRPSSGQYLLDGTDVATLPDDELSRVRGKQIGFIFQAFNLIPQLTVLENVEVPLFYQGIRPNVRRERAAAAIARVGLDARGDHRPSELSGGQQQRVAIARALVNDPAIIMADEPTGNLDSATGQAILQIFDDLHDQGLSLIVVTHDPGVAHRTQRTIRLRDGHIESDRLNAEHRKHKV